MSTISCASFISTQSQDAVDKSSIVMAYGACTLCAWLLGVIAGFTVSWCLSI